MKKAFFLFLKISNVKININLICINKRSYRRSQCELQLLKKLSYTK